MTGSHDIGWVVVVVTTVMAVAISVCGSPLHPNTPSKQPMMLTRLARASRIRPIAAQPLEMSNAANSDSVLATHFLTQYGYFRKGKPSSLKLPAPADSGSGKEDDFADAVRMFQSYFGLRQTGMLDRSTVALMSRHRCGVADIPEDREEEGAVQHSSRRRQRGLSPSQYALLGTKWKKNRLTWRLDSASTSQLTASQQRRTMQEAIDTWRRVAPLEFEERGGRWGKVDIDIKFGARHHGDNYPFDGAGKVLAHAFGPGEGDLDGDMHFDDDETWAVSGDRQKVSNLLLVATHELGHSLGLSHSRDPGALMYPYYGLTDRLGQDDIKAIQSLYGIRIGLPRTTKAPPTRRPVTRTPRPTRAPITRAPVTRKPPYTQTPRPQPTTTSPSRECDVKFDVVIQDTADRQVFTGFQGEMIYRFSSQGLLDGYPTHLHVVYPQAPPNAEVVFSVPEKFATYFIKDSKVWRFVNSQLDSEYPKDLTPTHFPEVIRFVLPIVDSAGHRRIFVFGRTLWWEYNFDELPSGHFRARSFLIPRFWPAMATDVQYGVMGTDNYLYLISPNSHVVLDSFRRRLYNEKQEGHPQWMQPACHLRMASSSRTSHDTHWAMTCAMAVLTVVLVALRID